MTQNPQDRLWAPAFQASQRPGQPSEGFSITNREQLTEIHAQCVFVYRNVHITSTKVALSKAALDLETPEHGT
jgi:hypothetical protein